MDGRLFCVEVGARGYCSESVSSCLAKLGFQPKFKRETLKSLGLTAMKASFALWLARADKSKIFEQVEHPEDVPKVNSNDIPAPRIVTQQKTGPSSQTPPTSVASSKKSTYFRKPVGLRNLGETCYVNVILQCLAAAKEIWSSLSADILGNFSFLKYLVTMLKLMASGNNCVDPKFLVDRLGTFISTASGSPFIPNRSNDAPEVLGYILNNISTTRATTGNLFTTSVSIERTCDSCQNSSISEDSQPILRVPIRSTVGASLREIFRTSMLDGENQLSCSVCHSLEDGTSESKLTRAPEVLIIQLLRFTSIGPQQFIKNTMKVSCDTEVSLSEADSDPPISHVYRLVGIIDHSGTFSDGHYTCFVLDRSSNKWFLCNDSVVKQSDPSLCKNPYVFFYIRKSLLM